MANDVLNSLAAERAGIMASIRGDNAGPQTVLRRARPVSFNSGEIADPYLQALMQRYESAMTAAQQGVQDASLAPGADIIYGSPQQTIARLQRQRMMQAAAQRYNSDLRPQDIAKMRRDVMPNPAWGI